MPEKTARPNDPKFGPAHMGLHYYSELNRVISFMFVGVLALMTFLLTIGVQRPHATFAWAVYATIIVLPLNLIAFVVGHLFQASYLSKAALAEHPGAVKDEVKVDKNEKDNKKDEDKDAKKGDSNAKPNPNAQLLAAGRRLKVVRICQQTLFVVAVACVAWLAFESAHFFFSLPAASPAAGVQ